MTPKEDTLAYQVIGCAMEVYKKLGPGLLESVYQKAMMKELSYWDIPAEAEVPINILYRGDDLGVGFRMDILVDNNIILELKSVAKLDEIHYKQLLNYLLLADKPLGYLINFNVPNFTLGQGYDKIRNLRYTRPIPDWVI
jgi:GxxExxY protein